LGILWWSNPKRRETAMNTVVERGVRGVTAALFGVTLLWQAYLTYVLWLLDPLLREFGPHLGTPPVGYVAFRSVALQLEPFMLLLPILTCVLFFAFIRSHGGTVWYSLGVAASTFLSTMFLQEFISVGAMVMP
jgi:hypothetical protein